MMGGRENEYRYIDGWKKRNRLWHITTCLSTISKLFYIELVNVTNVILNQNAWHPRFGQGCCCYILLRISNHQTQMHQIHKWISKSKDLLNVTTPILSLSITLNMEKKMYKDHFLHRSNRKIKTKKKRMSSKSQWVYCHKSYSQYI